MFLDQNLGWMMGPLLDACIDSINPTRRKSNQPPLDLGKMSNSTEHMAGESQILRFKTSTRGAGMFVCLFVFFLSPVYILKQFCSIFLYFKFVLTFFLDPPL